MVPQPTGSPRDARLSCMVKQAAKSCLGLGNQSLAAVYLDIYPIHYILCFAYQIHQRNEVDWERTEDKLRKYVGL